MSLLFSCGMFSDYHRPGDTADKLDYQKMARSTETIFKTLVTIANSDKIEKSQDPTASYHDELLAVSHILDNLNQKFEKAGLTEEENQKILALAEKTRQMIADADYSGTRRRRFVGENLDVMLPVLALPEEYEKYGKYYLWHYKAFFPYIDALIAEYKKTIAQAMDNKMSTLIKGREFSFKQHTFDDADMSLVLNDDGDYELDMILSQVSIYYKFGGLSNWKGDLIFNVWPRKYGCTGSKEDIVDYCLLLWRNSKNPHTKMFDKTWPKVFKRIDGEDFNETYQQRLDRRLKTGGFDDKNQWLTAMLNSEDNDLLIKALQSHAFSESEKADEIFAALIKNKDLSPDVRDLAIMNSLNKNGNKALLAVADVLDDDTLYKRKSHDRSSRDSYPMKNHPLSKMWYELLTEEEKAEFTCKHKKIKRKHPVKTLESRRKGRTKMTLKYYEGETTIGQIAEFMLKMFTGKNFKKDKKAWKKWILENEIKCGCDEKKKKK